MANQMGEIFLARQQYFGFKKETDHGVAVTLSNSEYKYLGENLKLKINIKENQRKYAVGDPYAFVSVMGAQHAEFSVTVHVQGSGVVNAAPAHWDLLELACFTQLTPSGTFYASSLQLPNATGTFEFEQKENAASSIRGKKYRLKGAAATKCTEHYDGAGQLQKIDFTFMGALTAVTDLTAGGNAVPVLTADTGVPPAVLAATVVYGGLTLPTNGITVDYGLKGNLVEYPPDPTGYAYTVISDLDPIVNMKVLIQLEATLGVYAALTNVGSIAALTMTLGSGITGTQMIDVMPQAQIVKGLDIEARDGIDEQPLMFRGIRNTAAVHSFAIPIFGKFMPIA